MVSKNDIEKVWEKGKLIRGKSQATWRRDAEGNKIRHGSYGTQGDYGWEVDHEYPESRGGSNALGNLQPLHWEANREKGNKIKKRPPNRKT